MATYLDPNDPRLQEVLHDNNSSELIERKKSKKKEEKKSEGVHIKIKKKHIDEEQLNEIKEEIHEKDVEEVKSYLDLNRANNACMWIFAFLLLLGLIYFAFNWIYWSDARTPHHGFHEFSAGSFAHNDEEAFTSINSYEDKHWEYMQVLPDENIINKEASICNDFYGYSCGKYNGSQNMILGNLKNLNTFEMKGKVNKNNIDGKHASMKRFRNLCEAALLGMGGNVPDLTFLHQFLSKLQTSPTPLADLTKMGIMPLVLYSSEDRLMKWDSSPWLIYDENMISIACAFLYNNDSFSSRSCVDRMEIFYKSVQAIISSTNTDKITLTPTQVNEKYPELLTEYASKTLLNHVIWSEYQVNHLYTLLEHDFFKEYLFLLPILSAYQFIPAVGRIYGNQDQIIHSGIYYERLERNINSPSNNHHLFRHGFGMLGLQLVHSTFLEKAEARVPDSCNWLTGEMFPVDLEQLRENNRFKKELTDRVEILKAFLKRAVQASPAIHNDKTQSPENTVKFWYAKWIDNFRVQYGFPTEVIVLRDDYSCFLEMVWDIQQANMNNNFHLSWPPSFHSSTCNAMTMVNEQLILIPYCLYRAQWLKYVLDFIIFHEMMHLNFPLDMATFGANLNEMENLNSKLTCMDIEKTNDPKEKRIYLERFADIIAARLTYQLCIEEKNCTSIEQVRSFLISLSQFFCNNQNSESDHGSDQSRISYILKHIANKDNVSPFHEPKRWLCQGAQNVCKYF